MNAYEEVLSWAETRPWWQQKVLARIIAGVTFGEQDYEDIARSLMEEPESPLMEVGFLTSHYRRSRRTSPCG